jgi:serine/threonine protein kinase/class 3 adenylate cyclase
MDGEPLESKAAGNVAEVSGDSDIDQLLRARGEIDTALKRHRAQFAVLFTDIVGSTSFFERYGDTAGLLMLRRHDDQVMPAIEEGGGTVVKTIGDAVLATFTSAKTAAETAVKIQQRLNAFNEGRPAEEQIYVRVGINYGTGFLKEGDIFGDVVNVAARFVKNCAAAQILISRSVYDALKTEATITCQKLGTASFHGKAAPEEMYEVLWTSAENYTRIRALLDAGKGGAAGRNTLGRYQLLEELGRGAMGVVYKAFDPAVGRVVALKTVRLDITGPDREELIRRLRQEAQAAGRLEHPNIVTIYDAGEADGLFYLTMQFVKGQTLGELIAQRKLLPVKEVLTLIEQLCEGLHYAHERGIVHRDLKPSNIITTADGVQKVVDFGVAKIVEAGTTRAGMVVGTPSYMSPEQAQGGRVDRRSDIFSLGAIFYELLTGEKPFPGNTPTAIIYKIIHEDPIPPRAIEPTVDPRLEAAVRKALAKSPFERFQTCREFQEALRAASTKTAPRPETIAVRQAEAKPGQPALATTPAPARPRPTPTSRGPLALALGLLVVAGLALAAWQQGWLSELPSLLYPDEPRTVDSVPTQIPTTSQPPPPAVQTAGPQSATETGQATSEPASQQPSVEQAKPAEPPATTAGIAPETKEPPVRRPPAKPRPTLTAAQQQQIRSWFRQAEQYISRGQYNEAAFALKQVLQIDPDNQKAKAALIKVRRELQRAEGPGN